MAMAIIGGIMAMAGSFFLWYMDIGMFGSSFIGVQDITNDNLMYTWLIPLFGLLATIFGIVGFVTQKKALGIITALSGLLSFLIAIIVPIHYSFEIDINLTDAFFMSSEGMMFIYIGGIIAIIGGLLAMVGGFSLSRKVTRVRQPAQPQQYYR
jgi:hypothetical protein